ncbi:hypothetical protein Clacol_007723 [Clathrus columnatus]|uniref:NADP-dependent oxidoreductase domain-containing protein n=1 Tax=Clathrus columnatus TaxID=1419009 RepID=A0AAV5AFQ2_9AGAM|nr:hypothetical protein Clacol_007723 [Clathrus columnatus]
MVFYAPAPEPSTKLGRYRILSPNAGVRVSPLQLGAMGIGDQWEKHGFGAMNKESSFKLLDAYYNAGGNFIDVANNYQDGSSEEFIGEWMELRNNRDQMVISTKYTANLKRADDIPIKINYYGNHRKSLKVAIETSLKRLRTNYIDVYYVHFWVFDASVEEVMSSLHNLIVSGKVLYLGISDAPAWIVSKANEWARAHGKTPFSIYQGNWSILDRSFERDIIPMARSEGLALAPWGVVGGGRLRTDEEENRRKESGEKGRLFVTPTWERTESEVLMSRKLEEVAKEVGVSSVQAVAIAYVMHILEFNDTMKKAPYVFPLVGARKVEHLMDNIKALDVKLSKAQIQALESVLPFEPGFPHNVIGNGVGNNDIMRSAGHADPWMPVPALPESPF